MKAEYDLFADQYDVMLNASPYRPYVEAFTFFEILGNVKSLKVLDLATGTGYYARACAKMGASEVLGLDLSKEMIEIARQAEASEPFGISYEVGNAATFEAKESFDIIIAVYLLHYAPNLDVLRAMCKNIAANLKSGARFVTYQMNPQLPPESGYFEKYGLFLTESSAQDGEQLAMQIKLGGQMTPEIPVYRWNKTTIETVLEEAGFKSIQWHQPRLSPSFQDTDNPADFFDDYLRNPHAIVLEATRT